MIVVTDRWSTVTDDDVLSMGANSKNYELDTIFDNCVFTIAFL